MEKNLRLCFNPVVHVYSTVDEYSRRSDNNCCYYEAIGYLNMVINSWFRQARPLCFSKLVLLLLKSCFGAGEHGEEERQ